MKPANEIRKQFIDFFKNKKHKYIQSSSVFPKNDPTLLFTNAGMNQFKPYFLDIEKPKFRRAVNSQKCIRVSGKHNDLEEVGIDDYHHTYFEMLGNWSFGDYYKDEAIKWAWELLTEVWKLDKDRLWVTIFKDDDESGEVWKKNTDIDPKRILRFGHKENFWEMGETGPCGPCTEIHYYTGESIRNQKAIGVNKLSDYREIWNLVFIQYNRKKDGALEDLPSKHVDTGAGFERLVAILNGKSSNYETDLFIPILNKIEEISGKKISFNKGVSHRVIADHIRMISFSIADGAMPSNDGRGYVIRRVLRRAARFGRMLNLKQPFMYKLVDVLSEMFGEIYPELMDRKEHIQKVIKSEETSFGETLDRGLEIFEEIISSSKNKKISGQDAFKLYDTYGFPIDLTQLIAKEKEFIVDKVSFDKLMEKQKARARSKEKFISNDSAIDWIVLNEGHETNFIGYDQNQIESKIIKYNINKNLVKLAIDQTPFYAESGGQVSDIGFISNSDFKIEINDVQKHGNDFIHYGKLVSGEIKKNDSVLAQINLNNRQKIKLNHTATHLLHKALKEELGTHVQQAGSLVASNLLRFDLTHYEKLTLENIFNIENNISNIIRENIKVSTSICNYQEAKKDGAEALFGEQYGENVRVVDIPGFSKELCGGTHVDRTGDIGGFKIVSESSLATGIRRIVAITGSAIPELLSKQELVLKKLKSVLNCNNKEIVPRIELLLSEKKQLEKEIHKVKSINDLDIVKKLITNAKDYSGIRLIISQIDFEGDIKLIGDSFRKQINSKGIALIGLVQNNKPIIMCAITDDLTKNIQANVLVKKVGKIIDGGGGGKSHLATAGGKKMSKIKEALLYGEKIIKTKMDSINE
tara:strand:+ start:490 stop:3087 length:2598 start_codon:yes stop_codon:yes gene_type:complete